MVARDLEIERDDLYPLDRALDKLASPFAVSILGDLDSGQKYRDRDGADRNVRVVRKHIGLFRAPTLERDQSARVEDQSLHGSSVGALPTNRRTSARSCRHALSDG